MFSKIFSQMSHNSIAKLKLQLQAKISKVVKLLKFFFSASKIDPDFATSETDLIEKIRSEP